MTIAEKEVLLEVKDMCVDYLAASGVVHAVDHVNLTLKRGEILGLAGESGSGKSTLAYAIARLLRPPAVITGGEVLYHRGGREQSDEKIETVSLKQGKRKVILPDEQIVDILDLTAAQLRAFRWNELSIVFQSAMNALNPVLTIGTQIMDVLKTHRPMMGSDARYARAAELLKLVGIASDRLKSYPHELSGGMRQRAIIAIALALNPEMIIMDEPTTALDVVVQREILQLVSNLCKEFGMTMIFITHDLSLLIELADKIAIMYAGKLVETAPSRDIYLHPRHPYSYGLLNSFPTIHGPRHRMAGIPGSPPDLRIVQVGCPFIARCPLRFESCATVAPRLEAVIAEAPEQLVACHLYDAQFSDHRPTQEELASSYEVLAERSIVQ